MVSMTTPRLARRKATNAEATRRGEVSRVNGEVCAGKSPPDSRGRPDSEGCPAAWQNVRRARVRSTAGAIVGSS